MSKSSKLFLGICTFLPLLFGVIIICYYVSFVAEMIRLAPGAENDPAEIIGTFFDKIFNWKFIGLCIVSVIAWLTLMIYYILHAVKNIKSEGEKIMWILLFIFIGTISFIVYFFMRVVPIHAKNEIAEAI